MGQTPINAVMPPLLPLVRRQQEDIAIKGLRDAYVDGLIELDTFEQHVGQVLAGGAIPGIDRFLLRRADPSYRLA